MAVVPMSALVIADLHLSVKARDEYRFAAMQTIASLIEKHKPRALIILGDLTEEKDYHPATLVNDVSDVIYSFAQLCPVYILMGNHDYTSADCPFFHFLRRIKNVHWITKVSRIDMTVWGLGDCLFLPHTRDWKTDWAKLPHLEEVDDLDFVFAHNTFEGAESEHGKRLSGIPLEALPNGIPVISGDIHTPQTIGQVTYVGSPYRVDFGDTFEPRALLLGRGGRMTTLPVTGTTKRLLIGRLEGNAIVLREEI
jgi:DNA repair exonuclease SbcCD nuclease subunit